MTTKERIIKELVYSASGRFSACETQQDFIDHQRLYAALLTERIDELIAAERERCALIADQHRDGHPAAMSAKRAIAAAIRLGLEP